MSVWIAIQSVKKKHLENLSKVLFSCCQWWFGK